MQIKNAHIAKQTNHFTIDEIYSTNNMDNIMNRSKIFRSFIMKLQ